MYKLNFKEKYNIIHICNEIGANTVGGAGTYINEIYHYKRDDMGFIQMNSEEFVDFDSKCFPGQEDILAMSFNEHHLIANLDFEILVVQFWEFALYITDGLLKDKKIAYVVHSIPTPEPPPKQDPFDGSGVEEYFVRICDCATVIICVSNAEKEKLLKIYPHYDKKIRVVHNGITMRKMPEINTNYKKSRRIFGFIGRVDYRKGMLECIKAFKKINDAELRIACARCDEHYLRIVLEYIEAADLKDKVKFYGWCTGQRKENFYKSLDALIIPSLYDAFPYAALEGMQYEIPIISSNTGGLDEMLEGYKYKYFPYEDGALERQIHVFMDDSETEIDQQVEILRENLKRFRAEKMVEDYNKIWDELLKND